MKLQLSVRVHDMDTIAETIKFAGFGKKKVMAKQKETTHLVVSIAYTKTTLKP
ncbi:hypothetical protein [Lysinibacillus fusiformis]|uniref:hypothetical protein n=1 Tax=Lysinibacillus fusiformis TaxID=28031 RepID=UPI0013B4275D|nr:hypothetical protein [Lysinibacillus fusiformis]